MPGKYGGDTNNRELKEKKAEMFFFHLWNNVQLRGKRIKNNHVISAVVSFFFFVSFLSNL